MRIELSITGAYKSQIHAFLESLQNAGINPPYFIRTIILDIDDRNAAGDDAGLCRFCRHPECVNSFGDKAALAGCAECGQAFLVHDSTDHRFVEPAQNYGREAKRNNGLDGTAICDECGRTFDPVPFPQTSTTIDGKTFRFCQMSCCGKWNRRRFEAEKRVFDADNCGICGAAASDEYSSTYKPTGNGPDVYICSNRCLAEFDRRQAFENLAKMANGPK